MSKLPDLTNLSDEDLLRLNHQTIALLKTRERLRERQEILAFEAGNPVLFEAPDGGRKIRGAVIRVNQKSLTIATDGGTWRVAPCFVKKVKESSNASKSNGAKLLHLHQPQE